MLLDNPEIWSRPLATFVTFSVSEFYPFCFTFFAQKTVKDFFHLYQVTTSITFHIPFLGVIFPLNTYHYHIFSVQHRDNAFVRLQSMIKVLKVLKPFSENIPGIELYWLTLMNKAILANGLAEQNQVENLNRDTERK